LNLTFKLIPGPPGHVVMNVTDDGLGARLDGHVLHADRLLPLAAEPSQGFDLGCESPLELYGKAAIQLKVIGPVRLLCPAEHLGGQGVGACHLYRQGCFKFVLGLDRCNQRKARIESP